jgi:hypothetical protein
VVAGHRGPGHGLPAPDPSEHLRQRPPAEVLGPGDTGRHVEFDLDVGIPPLDGADPPTEIRRALGLVGAPPVMGEHRPGGDGDDREDRHGDHGAAGADLHDPGRYGGCRDSIKTNFSAD